MMGFLVLYIYNDTDVLIQIGIWQIAICGANITSHWPIFNKYVSRKNLVFLCQRYCHSFLQIEYLNKLLTKEYYNVVTFSFSPKFCFLSYFFWIEVYVRRLRKCLSADCYRVYENNKKKSNFILRVALIFNYFSFVFLFFDKS